MNTNEYHYNQMKIGCQKILPLVYDDSLSYYEVLCKVVAKLNELGVFIDETINDAVSEVIEEYFNKIMVVAVYDEETETITFKQEERVIVADGEHVYTPADMTMEIRG